MIEAGRFKLLEWDVCSSLLKWPMTNGQITLLKKQSQLYSVFCPVQWTPFAIWGVSKCSHFKESIPVFFQYLLCHCKETGETLLAFLGVDRCHSDLAVLCRLTSFRKAVKAMVSYSVVFLGYKILNAHNRLSRNRKIISAEIVAAI